MRLNPKYASFAPFLETLASEGWFETHGFRIYRDRNEIKLFNVDGLTVAVKSYGHIPALNRVVYGTLRKSKAVRGFLYAARLRRMGIDTPEEIAALDIRRGGILQRSYLVTVFSSYRTLAPLLLADPDAYSARVFDSLAAFIMDMHDHGILHDDLNTGNILYDEFIDGEGNMSFRFQVIDINRMRFHGSIPERDRIDNLHRLTPNVRTYVYILDRYASLRGVRPEPFLIFGLLRRMAFTDSGRMRAYLRQML